MVKLLLAVFLCGIMSAGVQAQRCSSISAASQGDWRSVKTAPHDGTTVEMLETYGIAPWYGRFKWTSEATAIDNNGKLIHFKDTPAWRNVDQPNQGVSEDDCLFWRPYKKTGKYVDPTSGAQNTVAYWCVHMHMRYNKKKDACE